MHLIPSLHLKRLGVLYHMFVFLSRVFKDFSFYFFVTVLLWVLILFRRGFVTVSPQIFTASMIFTSSGDLLLCTQKKAKCA